MELLVYCWIGFVEEIWGGEEIFVGNGEEFCWVFCCIGVDGGLCVGVVVE